MKARMPSDYAKSSIMTRAQVTSRHSMAPPAVKPHETMTRSMAIAKGTHTRTSSVGTADGDDRGKGIC